MHYSNKHNIPEAVFNAIKNDPYSKGDADFSVTGLLLPARIRALELKHDPEIVVDAMDRFWSLLGQSIHVILERSDTTAIKERRLFMDFTSKRISGGMDVYHFQEGILQDYKLTNANKVESGAKFGYLEWEKQLNIYAELLRFNNHIPLKLEIVALIRDWTEKDSEDPRRPKYPKHPIVTIPINLWPVDATRSFIDSRIKAHESAQISLPRCDESETWNGNRCRKWCNVSKFCSQYLEKK